MVVKAHGYRAVSAADIDNNHPLFSMRKYTAYNHALERSCRQYCRVKTPAGVCIMSSTMHINIIDAPNILSNSSTVFFFRFTRQG